MANLINIATDDKPLYVDAASITAVDVNRRNKLIAYNEQGKILDIDFKSEHVDPDVVIKKIAEAGNELVYFPQRINGQEYPYYIAPSAVNFAKVIKERNDETIDTIVGVKGVREDLESYATWPEQLQELLSKAKKAGKTMLKKYDISQDTSLYINPAAVQEISDNGQYLHVNFDNSSSPVSIFTNDSVNNDKRGQELFNTFMNERCSEFKDITDMVNVAEQQVQAENRKKRMDLSDDIASANGTLTRIKNDNFAVHVHPEAFDVLLSNEEGRGTATRYIMTLERQKAGDSQYPENITLSFDSAVKRAEAMEALSAAKDNKGADTSAAQGVISNRAR